jgi:hypothetical protein
VCEMVDHLPGFFMDSAFCNALLCHVGGGCVVDNFHGLSRMASWKVARSSFAALMIIFLADD